MKRKHEEGYALVYSLVVLLVLSAVAMAIMAFAGRELSAQQASIDRMQNQYEAQGKIEEIIGRLENNTGTKTLAELFEIEPQTEGIVGTADEIIATIRISSTDNGTDKYLVTIDCKLKLTAGPGGRFILAGGNYSLEGPCSVEYLSYEVLSEAIERQAAEEEGDG